MATDTEDGRVASGRVKGWGERATYLTGRVLHLVQAWALRSRGCAAVRRFASTGISLPKRSLRVRDGTATGTRVAGVAGYGYSTSTSKLKLTLGCNAHMHCTVGPHLGGHSARAMGCGASSEPPPVVEVHLTLLIAKSSL